MKLAQLAASGAAVVVLLCTPAVLAAKRGHKVPPLPKVGDPGGHFEEHGIKKPDPCKDLNINIGIALDTSGSIRDAESRPPGDDYPMMVAEFVTSSSGFPPANANLYYITFWDSAVRRRSPVATNAGGAQADFVRGDRTTRGSTNLVNALMDQQTTWAAQANVDGPVVVLLTDGSNSPAEPADSDTGPAADALKGIGATLITVGVGAGADADLLTDIASDGPNGKLYFPLADFDDIDLEEIVCCSIDTDGDGTVDCEDLCPKDPKKTDPGFCGCGEKDTFPCRCDLHEPGCKKHGKKHGKH